jgi:hypothetical protein
VRYIGVEAVVLVAVAGTAADRVGGHADGQVTGRLGLLNGLLEPGAVAADVELEHQVAGGSLADLGQVRRGHDSAAEDRATFLGDMGRAERAVLGELGDGADRRQHDRRLELVAKEGGPNVRPADAPQETRAEGDRLHRLSIAAQRGLGPDAAGGVVPEPLR